MSTSMAPSIKKPFIFSSLIIFFISFAAAQTLILPVTKDAAMGYVITVGQRTPLVPTKLVINLGGRYVWVNCDAYTSSTYQAVHCNTPECDRADHDECTDRCYAAFPFPTPSPSPSPSPSPAPAPIPGCTPGSCAVSSVNLLPNVPWATGTTSELGKDVLSLPCHRLIPNFYFQCIPAPISSKVGESLANGAGGMAGLGRSTIALPGQLSSALGFPHAFSLCLSSSDGGVLFNASTPIPLTYTPLIVNPVNREGPRTVGVPSAEYFIRVTSIRVKKRTVPLKGAQLSIDRKGMGGTKISTIIPYTILETLIYRAVTGAFAVAMGNVTRVPDPGLYELCYDAAEIGRGRSGPKVPVIDLVMGRVVWRMYGANTMVKVAEGVLCLGFVDAEVLWTETPPAVVIGTHQLEDNLLEFDVARSRLGFSGLLRRERTTCARVVSEAMRSQHS